MPLAQGNQWTRYPTNGHGRKTTWIAVHRLRCTVRRFVDQRSYSATQSAVCAGVDKTTSRCQGDGTYYPNGRLLCTVRASQEHLPQQTNKQNMVPQSLRQPFYDRQRVKIKSTVLRFVNRYRYSMMPGTVRDFRPRQPPIDPMRIAEAGTGATPVPSIHWP